MEILEFLQDNTLQHTILVEILLTKVGFFFFNDFEDSLVTLQLYKLTLIPLWYWALRIYLIYITFC